MTKLLARGLAPWKAPSPPLDDADLARAKARVDVFALVAIAEAFELSASDTAGRCF